MVQLNQLVIFRSLQKDPIILNCVTLINSNDFLQYKDTYYNLINQLITRRESVYHHIINSIIHEENEFILSLEKEDYELQELDYSCLLNDLTILSKIFSASFNEIASKINDSHNLLGHFTDKNESSQQFEDYIKFFDELGNRVTKEDCNQFVALVRKYGIGSFSMYHAFYLTDTLKLQPIKKFDPLNWDEIYSYEKQKEQLYRNTISFVNGNAFHNVLLVGSSGTGKSSSVKAVVQKLNNHKLRLIQVQKGQLQYLPNILEQLANRIFKFIIFIDDLSFETNEDEYKFLKSFIEGGISNSAKNVAFYVTSNRRHLIKESRSDRENDIHLNDFIQDMTSLSDRFGMTIFFEAPSQNDYFDMIRSMLDKQDINYDREELEIEARKWSIRHGGMSGRVAAQYVNNVLINNRE